MRRYNYILNDQDSFSSLDSVNSRGSLANNIFDNPDIPRAHQKYSEKTKTRRLSWTSVNTLKISKHLDNIYDINPELLENFKLLLSPPAFDEETLMNSAQMFLSFINDFIPSLKKDKTFELFHQIKAIIKEPTSISLYGLLLHYSYWNILRPAAKKALGYMSRKNEEEDDDDITEARSVSYNRLHQNLYQDKTPPYVDQIFKDHAHLLKENQNVFEKFEDENQSFHSIDDLSHTSDVSISLNEKEQLFLQLEGCINIIFQKLGKTKFHMVTGRQSLISCCHYIIDEIFTLSYPWFARVNEDEELSDSDKESDSDSEDPREKKRVKDNPLYESTTKVNLKLRRLVHQSIADLIDPARVFTSSMLLCSVLGISATNSNSKAALKAGKKILSHGNDGRCKYYRTSTMISSLFGDTKCTKTRIMLQRGTPLYSSVVGSSLKYKERLPYFLPNIVPNSQSLLPIHEQDPKKNEPPKAIGAPPSLEPLNYMNLFDHQPLALYFPETGNNGVTNHAHLKNTYKKYQDEENKKLLNLQNSKEIESKRMMSRISSGETQGQGQKPATGLVPLAVTLSRKAPPPGSVLNANPNNFNFKVSKNFKTSIEISDEEKLTSNYIDSLIDRAANPDAYNIKVAKRDQLEHLNSPAKLASEAPVPMSTHGKTILFNMLQDKFNRGPKYYLK